MRNFPQHVRKFFDIYKQEDIFELYNEFSVYYRLGNHLEHLFNVDYKIQFMRQPEYFGIPSESLVKPHLDIVVFDDDMDVRHAIEVVYIQDEPRLEKLWEICTGLRFMEQIAGHDWQECYVLLIADLPRQSDYQSHYLFQGEVTLDGAMQHPHTDEIIQLANSYTINWIEVDEQIQYAVIPINGQG